MRVAIFLICLFIIRSPCFTAPIATFTPIKSAGMEMIKVEDGQWQIEEKDGRQAVHLKQGTTPASSYLYFRLSPEVRSKAGSELYLIAEFYDDSIGSIGIHYNSEKDAYAGAPAFLLLNTKKWQKALIHINGTRLEGKQNGGADFRLAANDKLYLSALEVYTQKPAVKIPTNQERIMSTSNPVFGPKDMYYTFGTDVNELTAPLFKSLGATSIETYVTWESCEKKGRDQWDWSGWDKCVDTLQKNNLKWVPFLILGPAYSTPDWFRASTDHVPCACLEHGTQSKIESLWNPNLPKMIDRFLAAFARRYKSSGVIESVLLGIQGDFGEAIYSVSGGGWTFNVPGEYHNHSGYWCDDPYAMTDFKKWVKRKYPTVDVLNKAWHTQFKSMDEVDFPGRKDGLKAFEAEVASGKVEVRRRWLDFIDWYRESMTRWSDWWILTTRKHFPGTPIYLCTGGDAEPHHGSNFAEQCKVAARYKAGVRITNESSNYAMNYAITRWVASAGKHYDAYYGFEPAGEEDDKGVVARIYNATASGANQLHDYAYNLESSPAAMESQREHLKYLFRVWRPQVPVALWYPNVSMAIKWGGYIDKAAKFREYADYDYIDETMLRTNALATHKVLVVVHGNVMETSDAKLIADWVNKGGRLIVIDVPKFESVEGMPDPEQALFGDSAKGRKLGSGEVWRVESWDELSTKMKQVMGDLGMPVFDLEKNGIYGTQIDDSRFFFLNTNAIAVKTQITWNGKTVDVELGAGTITNVEFKK